MNIHICLFITINACYFAEACSSGGQGGTNGGAGII